MKFQLYFIESMVKDFVYTGITSDINKRLIKHNNGSTISTKKYKPYRVIYLEQFESKTEALKRELYFKSPKGYLEKKRIIENYRGVEQR